MLVTASIDIIPNPPHDRLKAKVMTDMRREGLKPEQYGVEYRLQYEPERYARVIKSTEYELRYSPDIKGAPFCYSEEKSGACAEAIGLLINAERDMPCLYVKKRKMFWAHDIVDNPARFVKGLYFNTHVQVEHEWAERLEAVFGKHEDDENEPNEYRSGDPYLRFNDDALPEYTQDVFRSIHQSQTQC